MKSNRKLWSWLGLVFVLSFAALLYLGREIYLAAPPYPAVMSQSGEILFTADLPPERTRSPPAATPGRTGRT